MSRIAEIKNTIDDLLDELASITRVTYVRTSNGMFIHPSSIAKRGATVDLSNDDREIIAIILDSLDGSTLDVTMKDAAILAETFMSMSCHPNITSETIATLSPIVSDAVKRALPITAAMYEDAHTDQFGLEHELMYITKMVYMGDRPFRSFLNTARFSVARCLA